VEASLKVAAFNSDFSERAYISIGAFSGVGTSLSKVSAPDDAQAWRLLGNLLRNSSGVGQQCR
jgi:hypothetical protein